MVSLVLVSHSRELADALVRLMEQIGGTSAEGSSLRLAVAAGVARGPAATAGGPAPPLGFGTDVLAIEQAIRSVDGPDGVLVLMDLGSAVLAAESALELLPEPTRSRVRLCPAPLVEGAIAAASRIAAGGSLQEAWREAAGALAAKAGQLGETSGAGAPQAPSPAEAADRDAGESWLELTAAVLNVHGLHLRPASRLVAEAARFRAEVLVAHPRSGKPPVSALSLNGLSTLGLAQGDPVVFRARGPEAALVLEALGRLAREHFGETTGTDGEDAEPPAQPREPSGGPLALQGIAVSEGYAVGPVWLPEQAAPQPSDRPAGEPTREWALLEEALRQEAEVLRRQGREISIRVGADKGALFEAFGLILQDPMFLKPLREGVVSGGLNAEAALTRAIQSLSGRYVSLNDPYTRQRGADVLDLGRRLLGRLRGVEELPLPGADRPAVLILRELAPVVAARLDPRSTLGVLSVQGGATSHGAVLARSLGIPCVAGLPESLLRLPPGTLAALDGGSGRVWVAPDAGVLALIDRERARWLERKQAAARRRGEPAVSRDGRRFEVEANIASLGQAEAAVEQGAEGVGVLRTEFLYLDRSQPPSEEEQLEILEKIAARLGGRPLTVRTLDVGGDKPLAYLAQPQEANPYLGLRGLRLCLLRPDLFRAQLRAVLRAAAHHPVRLLLPMVTTMEELDGGLRALEEAHAGLARDGLAYGWPLPVGVMVETPSAALLAGRLLERVEFLSIGTNDLTQYTLAAERGNPALAHREDALHPAVLALIRKTAAAAARRGKGATVCGEIAGDPVAAPVLAGLGVNGFSLNPPGIPRVKETLRRVSVTEASRWARGLLLLSGAAEVRRRAAAYRQALPEGS